MFKYPHVKWFLWPIRARVLFELFYKYTFCFLIKKVIFLMRKQKVYIFHVFFPLQRVCIYLSHKLWCYTRISSPEKSRVFDIVN